MSGSDRPRLSVCLIVRDEADSLPACLAALDPDVGEVVVVDTGSRDGTPDLARRAGARVIDVTWRDDFAEARNAALEAARGEFCLMLDADEVVEPETWPALRRFLDSGEHDFGFVTIVSETSEGAVRDHLKRLCRNDGRARYRGRVHEQLEGEGRAADTGLVCHHSGYEVEAMERKDKVERNLRLLRLALDESPDDSYLHYQLGRTLSKRDGDPGDEVLRHLTRAVESAPADAPYRASAALDLGYALHSKGRDREALSLVQRFQGLEPRYTDLSFLEGLLRMALGDRDGMLAAFERCLALGEASGFTSVEGVGSYRAHHNLGLYRELAGQRKAAIAHYRAALAAAPDFAPSRERLMQLAAPQPRRSRGASSRARASR